MWLIKTLLINTCDWLSWNLTELTRAELSLTETEQLKWTETEKDQTENDQHFDRLWSNENWFSMSENDWFDWERKMIDFLFDFVELEKQNEVWWWCTLSVLSKLSVCYTLSHIVYIY